MDCKKEICMEKKYVWKVILENFLQMTECSFNFPKSKMLGKEAEYSSYKQTTIKYKNKCV